MYACTYIQIFTLYAWTHTLYMHVHTHTYTQVVKEQRAKLASASQESKDRESEMKDALRQAITELESEKKRIRQLAANKEKMADLEKCVQEERENNDALRQDVDDLKDRLEQALKHGDGERDRERYAY
jgi:predicted RNase H-like nuclease (RuvC/YqgF family)